MQGRETDTKGIVAARNFIVDQYRKNGLKPYTNNSNGFIQSFEIDDSISNRKLFADNIIAVIDNKSDSTIVLSAHYDHIGHNGLLSKEIIESKKIKNHTGADDNASGVAMLLVLSNKIAKQKKNKFNYVFVNFSAHEIGLLGSRYFYNSTFYKALKVKAFINLDMVGRLNQQTGILSIGGITDNEIKELSVSTKINVRKNNDLLNQNDITIFYENKVRCYTMTTGIHDDYHKITDTPDKINYEGMNGIYDFLFTFLQKK